jgi:hypothetical protein
MRYLLVGLALLCGLSFMTPTPAEARLVCFINSYGERVCRYSRPEPYYRGYGSYGPRGYYYSRDANSGCPRGYTRQDGRCKPYRGY